MTAPTKSELVEELSARVTKDDLVKLLASRLKKDELARVLDEEESDATKEQLVRKLASRTKDVLANALGAHVTNDELQRLVERHTPKEDEPPREAPQRERRRPEPESDAELDWNTELAWAPAPRPTPAPIAYRGAPPFMPSQRVRVDLSGLPMLGVFAGTGTTAAGTIIGVDARARAVRVYLDASFDGKKEIVLPPERIVPGG
jgi:hypothetical protein